MPAANAPCWAQLDPFIEAYERRQSTAGDAQLADFLPEPGSPLYTAVLRELVRADLEFHCEAGRPRRVEDYLAEFPLLTSDRESLQPIAFEEYRLRCRAGENPSPEEYQDRLGVSTLDWPVLGPNTKLVKSACESAVKQETKRDRKNAATRRVDAPAAPLDLDKVPGPLQDSQWHAELLADWRQSDPEAAEQLTQAESAFPAVGTSFLGFQLIGELGRGAFGRVYLASQGEMADRHVALKISADIGGECHTLAQLQHTNIVPIYSVHRTGPLQALVMPYFGPTTLADVLKELRALPAVLPVSGAWLVNLLRRRSNRDNGTASETLAMLDRLSYVDTVLWLGGRLAEGLAHAHARGIFHQDLKPANVLLADDGQPMLLDFNLSADTKLRDSAAAAYVGGTLPYMAPEYLEGFRAGRRRVDAGGDIYALGLILFELLTAQPPFPLPSEPIHRLVGHMIAARREPLPDIRCMNAAVTPAIASILQRCLAADPEKRYPSSRQLQEDLDRQRSHLPLKYAPEPSLRERVKKWTRRHPRLSSIYVVTALALTFILSLSGLYAWRTYQAAGLQAAAARHRLREDLTFVRLGLGAVEPSQHDIKRGTARAKQALARWPSVEEPKWQFQGPFRYLDAEEKSRVRAELGELYYYLARAERMLAATATDQKLEHTQKAFQYNTLAESCAGRNDILRSVLWQRAVLFDNAGQETEASVVRAEAEKLPLETEQDLYLDAVQKLSHGDVNEAVAVLKKGRRINVQDAYVHYALGRGYLRLEQHAKAAASFEASIALWPEYAGSYYFRAKCHSEAKEFAEVADDLTEAIRLEPDFPEAYLERALAKHALGDTAGAVADLDEAIKLEDVPTRAYFIRARLRQKSGDRKGAEEDLAEGLRLTPNDELSWVSRGVARLANEPIGALADFDEALLLNPQSRTALDNKAHVLSEKLGRTADAIQVLDKAVKLFPDAAGLRSSRGVLHARLKHRDAALKDAEDALEREDKPPIQYQVAGIFALTSQQVPDDKAEALRLLSAALSAGYGFDLLDRDPDLEPIRKDSEFKRIVDAAKSERSDKRRDPPAGK